MPHYFALVCCVICMSVKEKEETDTRRRERERERERESHTISATATATVVRIKMVRAPCCEKMGLKRGPWTPEEDRILVSHIERYGHSNWRALPKQAGLLRCGKSCRLRWTNYLRPDIKRGNFSTEEEETIINLHELLGNRWSAIAARLPGRTDNEIKNVWHTHLKKRVLNKHDNNNNPATGGLAAQEPAPKKRKTKQQHNNSEAMQINHPTTTTETYPQRSQYQSSNSSLLLLPSPASPVQSGSDFSSSSATECCWSTETRENMNASLEGDSYDNNNNNNKFDFFPEIDHHNFWSDQALSLDTSTTASSMDFMTRGESDASLQPPAAESFSSMDKTNNSCKDDDDDMDFWLRVLMGTGELPELLPSF